MAPFGKNFLKTRLKSRTRDAEPAAAGKEIQVSVCEEEKVVCGVTKHTTCADMVQALLEDHRGAASSSSSSSAAPPEARRTLLDDQRAATTSSSSLLLHGDPEDFCLLERWRGFERALPPLTRILRLWNAWGDQKPFIQFLLVKTGDFAVAVQAQPPHGGPPHAAAAGRSKGSGSNGTTRTPSRGPKLRWEQQQQQQQQQQFSQSLPVERQKRMVKKAFRKLEKLHKTTTTTTTTSSTSSSSSSPSSPPQGAAAGGAGGAGTTEDVDRMVQLILTQDHSIRAQIQRMRELDGDIQRFEAEAETTTQGRGLSLLQPIPEGPGGGGGEEEDSEYACSDGVEQLEEEVLRHRELIMELSLDIDAELRRAHGAAGDQEEECGLRRAHGAAGDQELRRAHGAAGDQEECVSAYADDTPLYASELQRLRAELRRGLAAGVSLGAQTAALAEELALYEAALASRDRECWRLAGQLRALTQHGHDDGSGGGGATVERKSSSPAAAAPDNNTGPALVQMVGLLSSQTVKLKHGSLGLGSSPSPSPSNATAADVADDTDSDTGISSTHSQDSLSPCGDFPFPAPPPPLDTDV